MALLDQKLALFICLERLSEIESISIATDAFLKIIIDKNILRGSVPWMDAR